MINPYLIPGGRPILGTPKDDYTGYVVFAAVTVGGGDYGHMPECKR